MGRACFLLLVLLWGGPALAAGSSVPLPNPPAGKGERCVAPTDIMRRDHPSLLSHQRDETVRSGVRNQRFSLKGCIACHAVAGADGKPVTYENPKHFCRACHDYTAVRIDCFECHASRPPDPAPDLAPVATLPTVRRWCPG